MIPFDAKNYRARREPLRSPIWAVIGIAVLLALLGWTGERDHQAKVEQVRSAAIIQCH